MLIENSLVAGMKKSGCAGDELDMLFEGAEQGERGLEGREGGFQGPRSVLSSFARFMNSLTK